MLDADDEAQRHKVQRRNVRRTATALWLIVAAIFFFMLAKYYVLGK